MTIGRLIQLYQAEQAGKIIMCHICHYGKFSSSQHNEIVKITEVDIKDLFNNDDDSYSITFYIKDEEDEYGYPIENE